MGNGRLPWDLFKWSIAHTDGTHPTPNLSEADQQWFMEAMQAPHMDTIKRMKEIALVMQTPEVLGSQGVTADEMEDMLDELQDLVAPIDTANDFHSIGGLAPLLIYLKNSHANIRAKAADVVTTIVQNNPRSQRLVMEANGLEYLLSNFTSDPDVTVRTKALGAISSLIRHNKPGITAFRLANGYAVLKDALSSDNVRFQRKALNLIHYLLQENSSDCNVVMVLGFPCIMMHLAASEDVHVREAALGGLLELAQDKEDGSGSRLSEYLGKLKRLLEGRINGISLMSPDDLGAAREERQLVDSIWTACFNEPSSLCEKGLLVLPGEDAPPPPPDVASRHFERPLRAWAAADATKGSDARKSNPPLLFGPGPPPNAAP